MPPDSPSPDDKTAFSPPPSRTASSGPGWTPPTVEHLQSLLPQYEIISMLGHGGMGAVYKGKQKSLDRLVAIKILPPGLDDDDVKFAERFKNEARTMAKLMHPGIVTVFDFGETAEGQLYFVMEYVDGTDVAKMIQSSVKLPPEHALAITAHVCDALAYAHANGVIHRDIKPANILINMQGQVKVADFGLAKIDDPAQGKGLTMTGMTMGTPDFVAPEALIMGVNVDGRADLYAIGVMLYQMLTGEIPRGLFQMPGELSGGEIDPRFDAIIAKAMQTNRESRYQSASAIRKDLDVILTTPRIKQDASQAVSAVPQAAVRNVPGKRSVAAPGNAGLRPAPGGPQARAPRKEAAPAAKPSSKSKAGSVIGIAATLVVAGGLVFMMSGKKSGGVEESDKGVGSPPAQPIKVVEPAMAATASTSSTVTWTDGLDEWLASPGNGARSLLVPEGSAHRMAESGCTLMLGNDLPMRSLANVAVRVKLRHSGAEAIDIHLREQAEAGNFYSATFTKTGATRIISRASMISADLASFDPPEGFDAAAAHTLEFRAEGKQLSVSLDGKLLGSASDMRFSTGQFSVTGKGALIESVEYRDLGKASAVSGKTIELLPLVDPKKDALVGQRSVKDGELDADPTRAVIEPWNDGLAEWWQNVPAKAAASILTKEAAGSRVRAAAVRKAIFLGNESKRAVLTAKATVRDISDFCALYLRHQSPDNYQAVLHKDGTTKIMLTKANGRELARSAPIPGFDPAKSHVFEFKADVGQFIVRVDGTETCRASDDTIRAPGTFYFTGDNGTLIEKLEYR